MVTDYGSYEWPPSGGGGNGVTIYPTFGSFPAGTTAGELAVAADTGVLYEWDGSAWQVIGGPGAALSIGSPANGLDITANTLTIDLASATLTGALSNTDWSTFNSKQPAGNYITALTGDGTASGPGSAALTLSTVNSNVGSFGTATQVGSFTVNGKGLITAAANTSIQIAESQVTNLVSDLAGKQPTGNYITALTGDVSASGPGSVAATLATVNSDIGSFTNANLTVNGKGLITAASNGSAPVLSLSVATANGFAGSFSASTTPVLTLTTTVTGILQGNGTMIGAATTTGSGSVVLATSPTLVTPILGTPQSVNLSNGTALPLTTGVTGILPIANGGTNAGTSSAAFNNLSPMTTQGDIIYGGASGAGTRLAAGTANQALTFLGSQTSPSWNQINQTNYRNYLSSNPNFEVDTTGYAAYANTAGTSPVTGTGGSPTVTITRSTSSPLFQTASGLFTHGASNQQGQGYSFDFTIDSAISSSGTPCTISGFYNVASGTYASGDLTIWIYDITNSQVIQPSGSSILNNIGAAPFQCEFQPNTSSTSYRLIFHVTTTTATAYTMQFDNLAVRPNTYNPGASVSSWQSYPLTIGATTTPPTKGTTSVDLAVWRRVGDSMEIQYSLVQTGAGSAGSGQYLYPLPVGVSIDTSKLGGVGTGKASAIVGAGDCSTNGSDTYTTQVYAINSTNLGLATVYGTGVSDVQGSASISLSGATTRISFFARVPIVGWGTTQVLSSDTATNVVEMTANKANGTETANTAIGSWTILNDTNGALNASSGVYTVLTPGNYFVQIQLATTSGTPIPDIRKNGTVVKTGQLKESSYVIPNCIAGDTITVTNQATLTATATLTETVWSIFRLPGTAQIAASESVNMRTFSSVTTISGSLATIVYATKSFDSHNVYNASTGVYTIPSPGKYQVNAGIATAGTIALNNALNMQIQQSGSASQISESLVDAAGAVSNLGTSVSDMFYCLAGDTLKVQVSSGATLPTIVSSNSKNFFSLARVGN